mmetsp:Transcript_15347/g.20344  ORF Transcript_15347/g.20344 Transcript_15347/m.20344 type:complete len:348 (-) Transcript_15347:161-1204(-)|eukprot:CAMPEP_0197287258 /NCGR_PEP_ID=MMETSP0890-20130614/3461_1 /TAXON_ID=44058 ORGANISM="Aureoumbra lagunensis, Strain CCMP1510" /NCGR_SAMPLE_ID=MMETSP0890 /ASSEMBLY_ACC=CAM_ASM_000533 /LENGTH=347 /DNA_ID=CAMNT_0042756697 /DNA_START=37 /DNA_END=1080 /DNA_ORIENTATION=+
MVLLSENSDSIVSMVMPEYFEPKYLSKEQYTHLREQGYVTIQDVVPLELCREIAATIRSFVGADDERPLETWYSNTLDIYEARTPNGKKPHHGPAGMVQMYHHASLWKLRQLPNIHACFADAYGTEKLWVTTDRAHFKPPQNSKTPIWNDAGPVHGGLHWDTSVDDLPVPYAVQGVVYLEDTWNDMGPLRVVPGSHTRIADLRDAPNKYIDSAVSVDGTAGTLVLWLSGVLHGPGQNLGTKPRVSAYVAMLPVDATPFQPAGRTNTNAPLSLADSGTLSFDDPSKRATLTRLDQTARVMRWKFRLPLLDEDPHEADLEIQPPGEPIGTPPFPNLSALGRKLVGLDDW